jgi:hypothetical protein
MEEFRPKMPLLVALRTEGMTERHWQALADKLKVDIKEVKPGNHHDEYNFNKLLEKGIMNHAVINFKFFYEVYLKFMYYIINKGFYCRIGRKGK